MVHLYASEVVVRAFRPAAHRWAVIASLVFAAGCGPGSQPEPQAAIGRGPHIRPDVAPPPVVNAARQLGWSGTDIGGYADEQRLSDGAGGYGPIVGAFAIPPNMSDDPTFYGGADTGVVVALAYVDPSGSLPATYTNLGLAAGLNCVRLRYNGTPNHYDVEVKPAANNNSCPTMSAHPPSNYVATPPGLGLGIDDEMWSVRFQETTAAAPLLGFRCPQEWCVVGTNTLGSIMKPPHFGKTPPARLSANGKHWLAQPWFDDQVLSYVSSPGKSPVRSNCRSSVLTNPMLEKWTLDSLALGFRDVAYVYIDPSGCSLPTKYSKAGFVTGPGQWNTVWLKFDKASNSWSGVVNQSPYTNPPASGGPITVTWSGHPGYLVPSDARWIWSETDESMWMGCDQGCCQVAFQ